MAGLYGVDWDAMDRAPWNHKCRTCGATYGQHKHRDLQCPRVPRGRWPWQWWGPTVFDWDTATPPQYRKPMQVVKIQQNQDGPHTLNIVDDRPKDYVDPRLRAEADLLITLDDSAIYALKIEHGVTAVCPSVECPGCNHAARLAGVPVQQYVDQRINEATAGPTMNEYGATHKLRQDENGDVTCTNCDNDEMWCLNNVCPEQGK